MAPSLRELSSVCETEGVFSVPEKLDNRAVLHYNASKMNDSKMKGELGVNPNMEFAIKTAQAYNAVCKPLCQELKLPQTAFDILMFLANNPDRRTASDIVEFRHIKANLVSMNVDRLVKEGYLERRAVAGDRRKTELLCTEKARPVIERGRAVQNAFFARLLTNTDEPTREAFFRTMEIIGKNLDDILKENA
jgi:DNA-binding MarR family transcriptional regulator